MAERMVGCVVNCSSVSSVVRKALKFPYTRQSNLCSLSDRLNPTRFAIRPRSRNQSRNHTVPVLLARNGDAVDTSVSNKVVEQVKDFIVDYYLPMLSLLSMAIGYFYPQPGLYLANRNCASLSTTGVFIVSGLLLERGEAMKAFDSRGALFVGLVLILLLTPLMAPLVMKLTLNPNALSLGLAVFLLTPTTLSSGVALIQVAGANVAMALLLTLMSNFFAVFTIPISLSLVIGFSNQTAVPLVLLKNLIQAVLAPTLLAYLAKSWIKGGEEWIRKRKKKVSIIGSLFLASIPWMQVSRASTSGVSVDPVSLTIVITLGISIHLIYLITNHLIVHSLQLGGSEPKEAMAIRRAVVLLSSQKTVTIALAVLNQLTPFLGSEVVGIACIPCVLVHFFQTIIDSILASYWAKSQRKIE